MKKTYVVAYTNFFDNDLTQEIVTASSRVEACCIVLEGKGWDISEWLPYSYETLRSEAFSGDTQISALCLEGM